MDDIKKEYIVTVKKHSDLEELYDGMETPGSDGFCPEREVELIARRNISRNTHYKLTESEANNIKNNPNVLAIELAPHERGIIAESLWGPQTGDFQKSTTFTSGQQQWGLKRVIDGVQTNNWGTNGQLVINDTIQTGASGKNVDLVIVDSHVNHEHPEFWISPTVNTGSRVNQIDWFQYSANIGDSNAAGKTYTYSTGGYNTGNSNHGTHVAGTAGGNTQGWARDSNIYNMEFSTNNVNSLSGTSYSDWDLYLFDYLREFHKWKGVNSKTGRKNPTITNHSWGYSQGSPDLNSITNVNYRGTDTTVTGSDAERKTILEANGVPCPYNTTLWRVPVRVSSVDADVEDAIKDGIIVVSSAGNSYWMMDLYGGPDYDNYYNIGATAYYHSKGSSPGSAAGVICVGSVGDVKDEYKSSFSNIGPRVDIWAPGSNIISSVFDSTAATEGYGTLVNDPRDSNFKLADIDGTSMSGPQVAGYLACLAEQEQNITQESAIQHIKDYSKMNQVASDGAAPGYGEAEFTSGGTYTWTCPAGITNVSAVCIGGGGGTRGGGGGGLGWKNNIPVVPGTTYNVSVGSIGPSVNGGDSYFIDAATVCGKGGLKSVNEDASGGDFVGDGGGKGGNGSFYTFTDNGGGGGAGGYSGNGGDGGCWQSPPGTAGQGGGAGGGAGYPSSGTQGAGGGGTGIYGEGSSGAGGTGSSDATGKGGSGGTDGSDGTGGWWGKQGGSYGGGGGCWSSGGYQDQAGGGGAVRIIWWTDPSTARSFPSTNVGKVQLWSENYKDISNSNNRYLYFQKKRLDEGITYPHDNQGSNTQSSGVSYPRPNKVTYKTEIYPDVYQWTFDVTDSGGFYVFADSYDRLGTVRDTPYTTVSVKKGDIIQFNVNAPTHNFWISNRQGTGMPSPSETPSGINGNGNDNAAVVWDTANVTPGTYWYNCQNHSTMYGMIIVTESGYIPA